MKSATCVYLCIVCCIVMLLCVVQVRGGCLVDSDYSHSSKDYEQRLYKYTSSQPTQPSSSSDLTFMTFNLQSGFITNCKSNVTAQAAIMRSVDFVGTQETVQGVDTRCNCNMPQTIANVAGMATRFVMALPWRTGQYGISAGTSQIILDTKHTVLTYAGYEQRVVVAVKTQPQVLQGRYLWFINVHVEYYSLTIRQLQIAQIHNFVKESILAYDDQAVIVMVGDFNGGPWDPVYGTMKLESYRNAWEEFHGSILDGNTIPADWPGSRFDHIWFRAPTAVTITVKNAEVPQVLLSDHRPFVATLSFAFADSISADSIVCVGPISQDKSVTIKCPSVLQKIASVQFASYGTPTGSCQAFKLGSCIGGSSVAVVNDKCVGRNTCTFPIANNVFGDPCPNTNKHFSAQVLCKVY